MQKPTIRDRGRGPEIEGTRITVYDVMDYYLDVGQRLESLFDWLKERQRLKRRSST